jgi:hypothetical protein
MEHKKKVSYPARESEIVEYITCDLCGAKGDDQERWWDTPDGDNVNRTLVQWKTGYSYPEGGSGETIKVDMCPHCFKDKLIPWLESQGAKPRKDDWDW